MPAATPEKARAASAKYRAAHPERVKAVRDKWRATHAEGMREYNAAYYAADPEKARARTSQWAAANPEKVRANGHRRRVALRGGIVENFTDLEIFERDEWVCQLCYEPIDRDLSYPEPHSVSLDHIIPVTKGGDHTRINVQAAHLRCNISKGNREAQ
jgi:5-methylcytosine-specific restriction endonuclease McrA